MKFCRTGSQWVVQKYIEQPLLIDGRKFDIRSYCLITPDHKIHMYKHSYIRTSSTAFDLSNLEDRYTTAYMTMHVSTVASFWQIHYWELLSTKHCHSTAQLCVPPGGYSPSQHGATAPALYIRSPVSCLSRVSTFCDTVHTRSCITAYDSLERLCHSCKTCVSV